MLLIESYMPAKRFPGLLEVDFSDNELYATLRSKYGLKPLMLIREIESRNARPEEARLLSIPRNKAISYVTNVALDEDNVPFEYSISRYRSDRHKFTVYMRC
jgi:GntR family transcriptional regulator